MTRNNMSLALIRGTTASYCIGRLLFVHVPHQPRANSVSQLVIFLFEFAAMEPEGFVDMLAPILCIHIYLGSILLLVKCDD